ncbi:MAG: hypothetical protein RL375_3510 [Pseudomonadota bacterium]|jgi:hypothetical protein
MNQLALLAINALGLAALAGPARAHEGHGLPGISHWHGDDAALFVLAAGVGLVVWLWRSK